MSSESVQQSRLLAVQRGFSLSAEAAAAVASELEAVTCRGGDWLFRQGDAADEARYAELAGSLGILLESLVEMGDRPST